MNTKRWIATIGVAVLAAGGGWLARGLFAPAISMSVSAGPDDGPCSGGVAPLYWKAPMNPNYHSSKPGKSPMGMDLVPVCPDGGTPAGGGIRVAPEVLQSIGVRTAPVTRRDLAFEVRTVGRVDADEQRIARVHTKVQGWIEKLHVDYTGQAVRRGEPLLSIYSPELVSTQEELLLAARYRDATEESPFADVSEAGRSLFTAAKERLRLWDIPRTEIRRVLATGRVRKTLSLVAPTDGVVTRLDVREGSEVKPNDPLYTIADLSHVWVIADVYEYELPWVRVGQRAFVDLSYAPGERFEGRVDYVYPTLDARARTARVRIDLPNPTGLLKPGMYANVRIETQPRRGVLAIPQQAVLRSGTRNLVMVALGEGRFAPHEVALGVQAGDGWVEIRDGLHEGERVVTSGQFLLDSESNLEEASQQFLAPSQGSPSRLGSAASPSAPKD